jgi:tRNA(fMet)-specific endonuclease VapC
MSLHILDTDTLTLFQDGHEAVCRRARAHPQDELAITVLSVEEQLSGWYTALRKAKNAEKIAWVYRRLTQNVTFLSRLQVIAFEIQTIRRYQELAKLKLNVRKMDLRIAATVLEFNATLVTRNLRDFKLVPGLNLIDWSSK